jgi:hypothetical protein
LLARRVGSAPPQRWTASASVHASNWRSQPAISTSLRPWNWPSFS